MTSDYSRRVERYLRNTYGIKRFERGHSGAHPILEFTYNGARRIVTLNRDGNRDGGQLLNLKLQDIRRELGDQPKEERKTKMQLKDMLPPATATAMGTLANTSVPSTIPQPQLGHAIPCRIARYKRDSIRLFLPSEVALRLFPAGARVMSVRGGQNWHIVPTDDPKPRFARYSEEEHEINLPTEDGDLFGMSPAEFVELGDAIRLHSDPAKRKPVNQNLGKHRPKQDPAPIILDHVHRDPRSRMLACLREIKDIEALGTHRLTFDAGDGGLIWQPLPGEVIKL